jgi:hypothetical protein
MSNYLSIKPLFFILCLSIIIFICGKIAQPDIDNNIFPSLQNEYKPCEFNNENNPKLPISEIDDEEKELKLKNNTMVYNNEISNYKLNLSDYLDNENKTKDLLIYTNFTEENIYYYFDNPNNKKNISLSTFDIVENQIIQQPDKHNLKIVINSTKSSGIGFIDFSFETQGLFEVNKNITREAFYNKTISIQKNNSIKYYINLIPTDNNSDAYFLQFTSTVPKEEKDTLNLYYLNSVDQTSIEGVKTALKNKPLKRDKKINGKIEIFAYEYSGENDRELTLNYNRIKGEGIAGFITSISALFFILIIIVIIFLKNTYS